jgi:hypothetical protein
MTKRTNQRLLDRMAVHYSQPKGFVGRNICYAITYKSEYYGHIVAGSATRFLPGRNEFIGINEKQLCFVISNIFFNVSPVTEKYPRRNFTSEILCNFVQKSTKDWEDKYGDPVLGFETLIEPPRTGELYRRAGWTHVGTTKGYTVKRKAWHENVAETGTGTDEWGGKRVWDMNDLRPKLVFCYKLP